MSKNKYLNIILILTTGLASCSSIKTSHYSAFNQFQYANEQPRFNFRNDTLKIEGAWNWANNARAIPKVSYLPKKVLEILKPIAKSHGAVLFSTWTPSQKKYSKEGYVPVTKEDVRDASKWSNPLFIIVLISKNDFKIDTSRYIPHGKNIDYQFDVYMTAPKLSTAGYWTMEVIAASKNRYYNFVCIADEALMSKPELREYQANLFLNDLKEKFLTQ